MIDAATPAPAGTPISASPVSLSGNTVIAYFFYGDGCVHCENAKPVILALEAKYPDLDIRTFEVYFNATNQRTFAALQQQYGIGTTGVPVLFIGKQALIGDVNIRNHLEEAYLAEKRSQAVCTNVTVSSPATPCPLGTAPLTPGLVIGAALVDSVNPCAFSVLIFLLVSVISLKDRRRVLLVGGCYIMAVFCFYLLSGLGLLSLVRIAGVSRSLAYLGAGVAIALGLISIIDLVRNRDAFLLAIPASRKEQITMYIERATLPASFVLGVLVGIFELPCTGGIYLAILGLVSTNYTLLGGLTYLLLYNVIFILPLVAILLLVAFGLDPGRADAWRIEHRRALRLLVGIAMILLGVVIVFGMIG